MTKRLKPDARRAMLVEVALAVAARGHYRTMTREQVAASAGVSGAAISYHFGCMARLRYDVMRAAVEQCELSVVAQGLADRHPVALTAHPLVRRDAGEMIARGG